MPPAPPTPRTPPPGPQSMIQLSRTQDEEVGDGTTSVIILAGELLQVGRGGARGAAGGGRGGGRAAGL
jgi:hypothetical protein